MHAGSIILLRMRRAKQRREAERVDDAGCTARLLTLGLVLSSPWWLLRLATTQRYREGLWRAAGLVPMRLLRGAALRGRRVVWVHAVSVGEVLAATRLVAELEAALGEGWCGGGVDDDAHRAGAGAGAVRRGAGVLYAAGLWVCGAGVSARAAAGGAGLMESELWPRMLHECRRAGVPVAVVNARVSDRSFARAMRVGGCGRGCCAG